MWQSALTLLWVMACAVLTGACGGEDVEAGAAADSLAGDDEAPLVMPDYPEPVRGHLVTRSDGHRPAAREIEGEWRARAGSCEDPLAVHLLASGEGVGALLVIYRVPGGDSLLAYPVVPVDSTVPEPPAVRVGVQRLRSRLGDSFQAFDGTVDLTQLDRRVSGQFQLHLVNIDTRDTVLYAGVFSEVRVRPWPSLQCGTLEEIEQPAGILADSTAADSLD